jgi:hypothetical protein
MQSKTIKADVIYLYGLLSVLFIFPAFIFGMALLSPIFTNEKLSSLIRNTTFFMGVLAIIYGTFYLTTAKCLISLNEKGIALKITKWGLGMWRSELFYEWSEVEKFSNNQLKNGMSTKLIFVDKRRITVTDDDRELYFYLKEIFSKK